MPETLAKAGASSCGKLLSVIIPVYNGEQFMADCLDHLYRSTFTGFETILVDDGSTDHTVEIARRYPIQVHLSGANRGPAYSRNLGASFACGQILFFLDADILVQPDSLAKIVAAFRERQDMDGLFGSFVPESVPQNFFSRYKNFLHHYTHQTSSERASTFCGGFGALRKDVFCAVGGFDPDCAFLEDVEIGLRLSQAGRKVWLYKGLQFSHCKVYSLRELIRSDVYRRAVPWTRLILRSGSLQNDLNTKNSNVVSVVLSFVLLLSLFTLYRPSHVWVALALAVLLAWLNRGFLSFVYRHSGFSFSLRVAVMQWVAYLYSGFGLSLGLLEHAMERVHGGHRPRVPMP